MLGRTSFQLEVGAVVGQSRILRIVRMMFPVGEKVEAGVEVGGVDEVVEAELVEVEEGEEGIDLGKRGETRVGLRFLYDLACSVEGNRGGRYSCYISFCMYLAFYE